MKGDTKMSKYLILLTMIVVGCGGSAGENPGGSGGDNGTGGIAGDGGSGGTVNTGGTGGVGGEGGEAGNGGTAGVGGVAGNGGAGGTGPVFLDTECGDGIDNDGDGLVDSDDPYCLGPYDNKESDENLGTGVGGEGAENCKADCYFDDGGGSGDDTCTWNHGCDPLVPMNNCSYLGTNQEANFCGEFQDPEFFQTDLCYDVCEPITPNGCDCFGCCEVAGVEGHVFLGTENGDLGGNCTLETPEFCAACTPQDSCYNELGECELGIGMTIEDLSPECQAANRCPDQETPLPCGEEGDNACPYNSYCITGCCVEIIVQ
jgi:hypothetical protein